MACNTPSVLRSCLNRRVCLSKHPRAFSSSCKRSRHGRLATFPPSSSSELDTLLANVRSTVFLPSHLKPMHQELIYRDSMHHFIQGDEPVVVPVPTFDALDASKTGEEQYQLEPMNRRHQTPTTEILKQLIPLLREKEDWAMVPAILKEMRSCGRKIRQQHVSKIIRAAAERQQYGFLIEMFKNCGETGLLMDTDETGVEIMLLCLQRAIAADWAGKDVEKGFKHAEATLWMMKQPNHAPKGVEAGQATRPEILGTVLALASINSLKYNDGQDHDGKVLQYSREFIRTWPKVNIKVKPMSPSKANNFLRDWAPAWSGLRLAPRIVKDATVLQGLKQISKDALSPAVSMALEYVQNDPKAPGGEGRRGMQLYNALDEVTRV